MRLRVALLSLFAALAFLLFPVQTHAEGLAGSYIFNGVGAMHVKQWNARASAISVTPAGGGKAITIPIPSDDPKAYKPDAAIMKIVESLKSGELVQLTSRDVSGVQGLQDINKYQMTPGEEHRLGYVFEEFIATPTPIPPTSKKPEDQYEGGKFRKNGITYPVLIPKKKDSRGKIDDDPDLFAKLKPLKKDMVVLMEVEPAFNGKYLFIKELDLYYPPVKGEFVKYIAEQKDENDNLSKPAVEIKVDDKSQTIYIEGAKKDKKWVPDSKLNSLAKGMKPGLTVEYMVKKDGDSTYIRELKEFHEHKPTGTVAQKDKDKDKEKDKDKDKEKDKDKDKDKDPDTATTKPAKPKP